MYAPPEPSSHPSPRSPNSDSSCHAIAAPAALPPGHAMDPGLIKLLEDDEEDESGPPVSGAAVDAYTERLKGDLGGGGSRAAAAAYGLARAGNGSLKPIASPTPPQAPTQSFVPPATGNATTTTATPTSHATPVQITQAQWQKLTPQQQQVYRQQLLHRQHQQQQLQQQQLRQQQQQQQQPGVQQAAPGVGVQAQRRPNNISQGISFGALMPLLQPHLPAEQSDRLSALYQKFKQNDITREDFVRGARVIVGDQVLVQTIRQMHQKQQQKGSHQAVNQQQSSNSSQVAGTPPSGSSSQAATPAGPNTQAATTVHVSESQSAQAGSEQAPAVSSAVAVQAQSLQQQQQQVQQQQGQISSHAGIGLAVPQQSKIEAQPQGSSQSGPTKVAALSQSATLAKQNQGGDASSQGVSSPSPPILQQVKNEVDKAVGPAQAGRPLQVPAASPFGSFQARPSTPHTAGVQVHSGLSAQVPKAPAPLQFSGLSQGGQVRPGFSAAMSDSSQQSDQKPLSKYAKAKLKKEQKKAEEERMRKIHEDERLRRQQVSASAVHTHAQTPGQVAQSLSMPVAVPQPHPKLLESKQQGVQTVPAIKQEPQVEQHPGVASQRAPVTTTQLGQVSIKAPGQVELPEVAGPQATATVAKDPSVAAAGVEKSQVTSALATSPMLRYPGLPVFPNPAHPGAGLGTATGSNTPQAGGPVRQGPPYVLASESRSPAMNFSTGTTSITKDATSSGSGVPAVAGAQILSVGVKTPLKKPAVAVGQKKPGEAMPAAAQPASKKQKTQGADADQSIDALNDVTAVSGVNLREEEEQLLAGPKEESRTTEAMRKFVQEEEERLFLYRGPLRAKAQAVAAKDGLRSVSEDVERCLSMAAEERLRSMLYKLIKYSKQRCDVEKDAHNVYLSNDPRRQVLMMKRKAKEAMEKKQADENERLRKLNEKKDKGALTDGENEDLRLKAQKAQQEEDDKMRAKAANVAARAAVGATDMLSKWQMMAAQGLAKRQGGDAATDSARIGNVDETTGSREQERRQENGEAGKISGSGRMDIDGDGPPGSAVAGRPPGPGPGTGRSSGVRRIGAAQGGRLPRSIAMKDVIALLEREPQMSKSTFLYRLYERDRKAENSRRI